MKQSASTGAERTTSTRNSPSATRWSDQQRYLFISAVVEIENLAYHH
jgi:hypothetical protein